MTRSLNRWQAILVGLAVLAGLGLGGLGLFAIGSRQWLWSDTFHVQAGFKQVRGVEPGTRVRVLGKPAGEVVDVQFPARPGGDVVLKLKLDAGVRHLVRSDATAQIMGEGLVGGKVVEIHPGREESEPVQDGAFIAARTVPELGDVLARADQALGQLDDLLDGVRKGEGSIGRLMTDPELYIRMNEFVRQGKGTLESIQQDANAIKEMPIIRSYVRDAHKLLVRPDCERNRQWFAEADLFEPGQAVLTAKGKQKLDGLAGWLDGLKHKGSEVVVVACARPDHEPQVAQTLTQKQSEAVTGYLVGQHAADKLGWFSRRKVTALGLGTNASPAPEKTPLPTPRIEVVVFVPQG